MENTHRPQRIRIIPVTYGILAILLLGVFVAPGLLLTAFFLASVLIWGLMSSVIWGIYGYRQEARLSVLMAFGFGLLPLLVVGARVIELAIAR